jgi:hypothetical protein
VSKLLELVTAVGGNEQFRADYHVSKTVLCHCRARENQFAGQCQMQHEQLADAVLFSLAERMARGSPKQREARRAVLEHFTATYPSIARHLVPNTTVWIAFASVPSEKVARAVMQSGFANLSKTDDGMYGSGIYLSMDAEYCIEEYGKRVFGLSGDVPLLVCAVAVGNPFPIVEMPEAPPLQAGAPEDAPTGGYFGKAIVPRAHAHVIVVARQPDPKKPDRADKKKFYPLDPSEWAQRRTYTE